MNLTELQRRVAGVVLVVIGAVAAAWGLFRLESSGADVIIAGIPLRFVGSAILSVGLFLLLAGRFRRAG